MNYFENFNSGKLRGFDLKIDSKIQDLCDLSNKSSGHSRAILYVLVIVSVTSIIAVINTFPYANWTKERIKYKQEELNKLNIDYLDSLPKRQGIIKQMDSVEYETKRKTIEIGLEKELNNKAEKIGIVELPIIGNTFDINNLAILTGISFVFVLLILRYTASREKKNLRIALHAITQRYPEHDKYINELVKLIDIIPETIISQIDFSSPKIELENSDVNTFNKIRRRYHYSYLTMNEVFNTPDDPLAKIERDEERDNSISFKNSRIAKFIGKYLFFFPFGFYLLTIINDSMSIFKGIEVSPSHTIIQYCFSYFCLVFIASLCQECNNQKLICQAYYNHFSNNDYKFDYESNLINLPERKVNIWVYPFALIFYFLKTIFIRKKITLPTSPDTGI